MATTGYKHSSSAQDDARYSHTQYAVFYASRTSKWYAAFQVAGGDDNVLWVKDLSTPGTPGQGGGWTACQIDGGSANAICEGRDTANVQFWWQDDVHILHVYGGHSTPRYQQMRLETNGKWTRLVGDGGDGSESLPVQTAPGVGIGGQVIVDGRTDRVATTGVPWIVYYHASTGALEAIQRGEEANWTANAAIAIEAAPGDASRSRVMACRAMLSGALHIVAAYTYCNATPNGPVKIAYRADSAAKDAAWTKETGIASVSLDNHMAIRSCIRAGQTNSDLHVIFKSDDGWMRYTSRNAADGVWAAAVQVVNTRSRPSMVLDSSNRKLYLFYVGDAGNQTGIGIRYKTLDVATLGNSWSNEATAIEDDGVTGNLADPAVSNHDVTATTELMVACQQTSGINWWNEFAIASPNAAPSVNAGVDAEITLPNTAQLDATVSDDGLPASPGTTTPTWSKISGSGTVTFTPNANTVDAVASFDAADTYVLRLSVTDGELTTTDDVTITVNAAVAAKGASRRRRR